MRTDAPPPPNLHQAYANIREQCDAAAGAWPQADKMRAHCHQDASGQWQPPAFSDGDGPIGCYAMLAQNSAAVGVLQLCRSAFERGLLHKVRAALDESQHESYEQLLFIPEERTWHTCIAVFHEHPSLLDEATRPKWRRVVGDEAKKVGAAVAARTSSMGGARLTLDSLCICADGALVAGFVDDEQGRAAALRDACAQAGADALGGELTSRPKKLLHVTLGRLLGAPDGLRPEQAEAIATAVRTFHATPLHEQLGTAEPQGFELRSVSLMRDSVWWMTVAEELATWQLSS